MYTILEFADFFNKVATPRFLKKHVASVRCRQALQRVSKPGIHSCADVRPRSLGHQALREVEAGI